MSPRYVIARIDEHNESFWGYTQVSEVLPDAEHVHLTRQADGTYTAVPMRRLRVNNIGIGWVDAPGEETGGES